MKGAVEEILKFCTTAFINGKSEPITALQELGFQQNFERAMMNGERILGTQSCFVFFKHFNYLFLELLKRKKKILNQFKGTKK